GSAARQVRTEGIEQAGRALLATLRRVQAVEVDALLGVGQPRSFGLGLQRDGGQRRRDVPVVDPHVVGENDALVLDNVRVGRDEARPRAAVPLTVLDAVAADAELMRCVSDVELWSDAEPLLARGLV